MRQRPLEAAPGPSYLLYPEDRRVEYGGGFRMIKSELLGETRGDTRNPLIKTANKTELEVAS